MSDPSSADAPGSNDDFAVLARLVREEWPSVDAAALEATGGDDDQIVALVATATEHTKALVRKQLAELRGLARGTRRRAWFEDDDADELLRRAGARAKELAKDLEGQAIREATRQVRKNPLASLLVAMGLGLLLGLFFGGSRRRG